MLERILKNAPKPLAVIGMAIFIILIGMLFNKMVLLSIALVLMVILLTLAFIDIRITMLLTLFSIPFDRMAAIGYMTVAKLLIGATIISIFIRMLIYRDDSIIRSIFKSKINFFVALYLLISIASVINAEDMDVFLFVIVRRTSVVILFFLVIHVFTERSSIQLATLAIILATTCVGFFGLYEALTGNPIMDNQAREFGLLITQEGSHRIQGVSGDPNFHATIIVVFTGILLSWIFYSKSTILKLAFVGALLLFIINVVGAGSRGGQLSLIITIAVFIFFHKSQKKLLIVSSLSAAILVVFIGLSILANVPTTERFTGGSGNKSIVWRIGWSMMAWEMVKDHPVAGLGAGQYIVHYKKYQQKVADWAPPEPYFTLNGIMQVWCETGTIGVLIFLTMLLAILTRSIYTIYYAIDSTTRIFALGLCASIVGYLSCMMYFPVLENENAWLLMGLSMALANWNDMKLTEKENSDKGAQDVTISQHAIVELPTTTSPEST